MKKFLLPALFLQLLLMSPRTIFAEDEINTTIENRIEQRTAEKKVFMEQKRMELKMTPPLESTGEMKMKREEMKAKVESLREEIQQKRADAKLHFQAQRDEFKQNMQSIKDERKKKTIENIDTNINELNTKHTEKLQEVLSKVTGILERIEVKVALMESEGKDTSTLKTSIANAHVLINTATDAVSTQAGKEYIINVTDETLLKDEVKKTFITFRNDIKAVHEKVKAAREAVVQTAKLYGELHISESPTIIPTATVTP